MTDKERLEEAKLMAEMLRLETRLPYDFPFDLVDWLVEQAERVQELESDSYNAHLERLLDRKDQEIERYREAIEYIQREIREAIYTPKNNKWNSDFEREFESGKTRGLIRASDIVKEAIEILEGEGK